MNNITRWSTAAIVLLVGGVGFMTPAAWSLCSAAQEAAEEESRDVEQRELEIAPEQLQRRLNEIEQLIDRAEQRGDEQQVRELRREGEQILDKLEEFERAREVEDDEDEERESPEEWERHARELEIHRIELEIERLHQELEAARQESAVRIAQISRDRLVSASYAISQALDHLDEEESFAFLEQMMEQSKDDDVRRLIRHRLAALSLHVDDAEAARQQLRSLILGE